MHGDLRVVLGTTGLTNSGQRVLRAPTIQEETERQEIKNAENEARKREARMQGNKLKHHTDEGFDPDESDAFS